MTGVKVLNETKLKRFLHYGSVGGTYQPGCRFFDFDYERKNIDSLRKVLNSLNSETIFDIIKKVYEDGSSPHPEMISVVLAECAKNKSLKHEALKRAEMLKDDTKLFLLFFKFGVEILPKIGTGPACKRLMGSYYLEKDVMKLAHEVAKLPNYRGWSHKDLMRLGHIKAKSDDLARQAVFTYITYGADEMNKKFGDKDEAKVIIEYLTNVQNFRKEKDEEKVVRTIETYSLSIEHLNPIHLNNKNVWIALMRQIPLDSLLDNFNRIARKKLFRLDRIWDDEFQKSFFDAIQDSLSIKNSGIHPNRVFVEYIIYKHLSEYKNRMASHINKPFIEPKKSGDITKNLRDFMLATYKNVKPINLKFLIAVEPLGEKRTTCHMRYLSSTQAASCVIDYFLNVEPSVSVVTATAEQGLKFTEFPKPELSIDGLVKTLGFHSVSNAEAMFYPTLRLNYEKKHPVTPTVTNVFEWASISTKEYDCFIVMGDRLCSRTYINKFHDYQRYLKLNHGKLVLLNLCQGATQLADYNDVLFLTGFDAKTLPIITSFFNENF